MYILEKIEDAGYNGTYTTSIVCSNDKEKIDILAINLKHNLLHIQEQMNMFRNYLDNKYETLRVQCQRTPDEIVEIEEYEEKLEQQHPDISKYDLFYNWFSIYDIEFKVKEIEFI